jgi:hypothetical protein
VSKGTKGGQESARASRQLFQPGTSEVRRAPRKRKTKASNPSHSGTLDLNLPAADTLAVVPSGLVSAKVNQIVGEDGGSGAHASATLDEFTKKQKRSDAHAKSRSAAAAMDSPRREP